MQLLDFSKALEIDVWTKAKEEIQDEEMLILNAKRKKTAFGDNLLEGKSKDD